METSIFFAQLFAPVLIFGGYSIISKRAELEKSVPEYFSSGIAGTYVGMFALIVGLAVVLSHNVWDGTWRTVVTLIGWSIVFKSIFVLISPAETTRHIIKKLNSAELYMIMGAVWLVFGGYLLLVGYGSA